MRQQLVEQLQSWRSSAADYTIGTLIAVVQMRLAERQGASLSSIVLREQSASPAPKVVNIESARIVHRCASCDATEHLVVDDETGIDDVVFCRECSVPRCAMDFPEFYCDIGGGD